MSSSAYDLQRLLPEPAPTSVAEMLEGLRFEAHADRPHVLLNMIASADGKATVSGRTAALGNAADRDLFHGLRAIVDAVMVGAATVRTERYGPLVRDPAVRERRLQRGLQAQPLACVVSASLQLPAEVPLLADPDSRVVVLTSAEGVIPDCAAQVDYIRSPSPDRLDPGAALRELRERFSVRSVLCEGGPHLNSMLVPAGVVDELYLSIAPKLAGGQESLSILSGPPLARTVALKLRWLLEAEGYLFARYELERGRRPPAATVEPSS